MQIDSARAMSPLVDSSGGIRFHDLPSAHAFECSCAPAPVPVFRSAQGFDPKSQEGGSVAWIREDYPDVSFLSSTPFCFVV